MLKLLKAWLTLQPRRHTVRIEVTSDDITRGKAYSSNNCPIALAAKRSIDCDELYITYELRIYGGRNLVAVVPLPKVARTFAQRFDYGLPVKPFSFEISYLNRRS